MTSEAELQAMRRWVKQMVFPYRYSGFQRWGFDVDSLACALAWDWGTWRVSYPDVTELEFRAQAYERGDFERGDV